VIPTKIIETTPNEDLQLSSESEEVDLPPKSVLLKQASELTHCKFAYKSHLLKRSWNIEELQNFHRPKTRIFSDFRVFLYIDYGKERRLNENPNSFLQFSKKETLTLAAGRFILCEYVEKKPVLMQNLGMASRICNYYTEYKDEEYMGELGITCEVEEMKSVRILPDGANLAFFENNLFVAPIFYHPATGNDFLMVRTPDGWIGRSFSKVFTVGQIEPKMEVVVPKSKRSRDFKDKHFISVILEKLFLNDNEIENESFKETVQEMKLTNAKKLANEHKIIKNKGVWTCEKQISKDDFRKMISPEEFVCYETLLSGIQELADLGITLKTTEKLLSSLQTLFKEMPDQQIRFVSGYIEEKVALSPWNLTSSYSKGKKKCNFSLIGRGDPTCGHCGYSFELLSKYSSSDLSLIKDQIRKTVLKEINLLGNSWYKHLDSSEDENEDQGINFNNFNLPKDSELLFDDSAENEQEQLKKFIQSLDVLKQPRPSIKKIIKKTIIIPLLPSGYKKVIKYIDDPQQINNFISKKHPIPKYFLKPKANREELEKQQKKQQEKIQKKLEIKAKKQEEAAKRKEERKIEREKEKILREQEWKSICLEKYNSGAVLFNTGTNSNVRCSRCNMIGHVKSNKRLCPAYVEDQLEVKTEANVKNSEMNKEQKTKKTKKMKKNEKKKKVEQKPLQKVKSRRREINEFEQLLVKLIEREQDKEIIQKSGGLMELLNMSEKGYSWTVDEMEEALKKVYGEDFEYFQDEIEELKFRQEIKASAPLPKKIKSKPKVQMIEESETLIINTL
jgi:transcription initiation factor TFIID subunit 1